MRTPDSLAAARSSSLWRALGWALASAAALAALDVAAKHRRDAVRRRRAPVRDYSDRSGFPGPPDAMRGRARAPFFAPPPEPSST